MYRIKWLNSFKYYYRTEEDINRRDKVVEYGEEERMEGVKKMMARRKEWIKRL